MRTDVLLGTLFRATTLLTVAISAPSIVEHVYPFQLVGNVNNDSGLSDAQKQYFKEGDWHDTVMFVNLEAETLPIRYRADVHDGVVMVHCHKLEHEDLGMMAMDRVVGAEEACTCTPQFNGPQHNDRPWQCFSDRTTVQVQGKGFTRMDQIEAGDMVLTTEGYSRFYNFGHVDRVQSTEFLQILAVGMENPLEITSDHMLYLLDEDRKKKLLPARYVKTDDLLVTAEGSAVRVVSVDKVQRRGIYAPFTVTGDIVVNGIAASNYIALPSAFQTLLSFEQQHWIQHAAYVPYRLYCLVLGCRETRDEATGLSVGIVMWIPLLRWLESHSQVILPVFLYMVAIPGHWALLLIEQAISTLDTSLRIHRVEEGLSLETVPSR